jgi:hypothetical protein
MSRGFVSEKALAGAMVAAGVRGEVMLYSRSPANPFQFMINSSGGAALVCVRRVRRIHGAPNEIAIQQAEALAGISSTPAPTGISRELWLWSTYGTLRFFRIDASVLAEIDRLGRVVASTRPGTIPAGKKRKGKRTTGMSIGADQGKPGSQVLPEIPSAGGSGTAIPAAGTGHADAKESDVIRYLRYLNRTRMMGRRGDGGG